MKGGSLGTRLWWRLLPGLHCAGSVSPAPAPAQRCTRREAARGSGPPVVGMDERNTCRAHEARGQQTDGPSERGPSGAGRALARPPRDMAGPLPSPEKMHAFEHFFFPLKARQREREHKQSNYFLQIDFLKELINF